MSERNDIAQAVHDAVRDGHLLQIIYDNLSRIVHPRRLYTDDSGRLVLVAFQIGGENDVGEGFGEKHFWLDHLQGAHALASDV